MIFSGCGKKEKETTIRIGVVISDIEKQYFSYIKKGMEDYKENIKDDVDIIYMDAKMDAEKQIEQIKYFIEQNVDAIVVVPVITVDSKERTDEITELVRDAKIPLVYLNKDPDEKEFQDVHYVHVDSKQTGRIQMEYLAKRLNGKGNVAILMGELNNYGTFERTEGVEEVVDRYPEMKIVDKKSAKWLRPLADSIVEEWLSSGM
jgi:inositol transport system substrate-binding protein